MTTVHKDVTDRLEHINPSLAAQARVVLDVNKSERHIRGGLATREKRLLFQNVRGCEAGFRLHLLTIFGFNIFD